MRRFRAPGVEASRNEQVVVVGSPELVAMSVRRRGRERVLVVVALVVAVLERQMKGDPPRHDRGCEKRGDEQKGDDRRAAGKPHLPQSSPIGQSATNHRLHSGGLGPSKPRR